MIDAGVASPLDAVLGLVRRVVGEVDVGRLDVESAAVVVERCAEAERLLAALRVSAAATLEDAALWRREGFRSLAAWMASKTGAPVGQAIAALDMAGRLEELPLVAEAFRAGRLSEAQAAAIAEVTSEVPEAEGQLVEAAGKLTLQGLREECRRVEAAAVVDEEACYRRVHRSRCVRSWVDRDGVGRLSARLAPDELARLMGEVDRRRDDLVVDALRGGWFENMDAHRADALVDLARPYSTDGSGPEATVHVVVDHEALVRGHTVAGERCEIPGVGPIPVTVARRLGEDAFLKVLVTDGVDVKAVAHAGRTIPAHLRSALEVRDPKCIVPRCDVRRGLQIDHRDPWSATADTSLDNLARLCRWHHYQKTFLGYRYRGSPGTWQWIPPDHHDLDLTALRRIITTVRRC